MPHMTYDELYALGDMDSFLTKTRKHCAAKIGNMRFAGMDREDVIQETVIKVYRALEKYNSNVSKLSTYVDHVIQNMMRDKLRQAGSGKNLAHANAMSVAETFDGNSAAEPPANEVGVGSFDTGYADFEFFHDIANGMGLLDREKTVLRLFTEGYHFAEISEKLGVSKSRVSQIWKSVQSKYEKYAAIT